jgi:hypothetical protein
MTTPLQRMTRHRLWRAPLGLALALLLGWPVPLLVCAPAADAVCPLMSAGICAEGPASGGGSGVASGSAGRLSRDTPDCCVDRGVPTGEREAAVAGGAEAAWAVVPSLASAALPLAASPRIARPHPRPHPRPPLYTLFSVLLI